MTDKKLTALTENTTPALTDIMYIVDDPGGTPASQKCTIANLKTAMSVPTEHAYLCYQDQKTAGTAGGDSTSGSAQVRALNTEVADAGGHGSLASNQITLAAGTYDCQARSVFYSPGRCKIFIWNATDSAVLLLGMSDYGINAGSGNTVAMVDGRFTIAASKAIELRYWVASSVSTEGLGIAGNFGLTEIYSSVELWKVG